MRKPNFRSNGKGLMNLCVALDQMEAEDWQCKTCSAPKQENDEHFCQSCRAYWDEPPADEYSDNWSVYGGDNS